MGLVIDKDEFTRSKARRSRSFIIGWRRAPPSRSAWRARGWSNTIQTTSDFSYYNRRLVGNRLLRVGDAAGFMDPIFSAGVFLAMWSGKLAAEAVVESLNRGTAGGRGFAKLRKARPARPEVLLAGRGELLHDALHGVVPPTAPAWTSLPP